MNKPLSGEQLTDRAAALAEQWHEGQEHFFGNDSYFNVHLKPIAEIVRRLGYGALFVTVAYLHDIKEDTDISDKELGEEGIPPEAIQAVNLLAKKERQTHEEYLQGILTSPLAIVAKFADSSFNYAWTILHSPNITDAQFTDWGLEYAGNIAVLHPVLPRPDQTS